VLHYCFTLIVRFLLLFVSIRSLWSVSDSASRILRRRFADPPGGLGAPKYLPLDKGASHPCFTLLLHGNKRKHTPSAWFSFFPPFNRFVIASPVARVSDGRCAGLLHRSGSADIVPNPRAWGRPSGENIACGWLAPIRRASLCLNGYWLGCYAPPVATARASANTAFGVVLPRPPWRLYLFYIPLIIV